MKGNAFVTYGGLVVSFVSLLYGDNLRERYGMPLIVNALAAVFVGLCYYLSARQIELLRFARRKRRKRKEQLDSLSSGAKRLLITLGKARGLIVYDNRNNPPLSVNDVPIDWTSATIYEELVVKGILREHKNQRGFEKRNDKMVTFYRSVGEISDKGVELYELAKE